MVAEQYCQTIEMADCEVRLCISIAQEGHSMSSYMEPYPVLALHAMHIRVHMTGTRRKLNHNNTPFGSYTSGTTIYLEHSRLVDCPTHYCCSG